MDVGGEQKSPWASVNGDGVVGEYGPEKPFKLSGAAVVVNASVGGIDLVIEELMKLAPRVLEGHTTGFKVATAVAMGIRDAVVAELMTVAENECRAAGIDVDRWRIGVRNGHVEFSEKEKADA